MILPFPLATSDEIARILRPGGGLRPDSALRTLRENALAAPQLSAIPRSGTGANGRVVWYSSLMLDVARLHRYQDHDAARLAHEEAIELTGHRSARHLLNALSSGELEPDPARLDASTGGALSRLALLTESRRVRLPGLTDLRRSVGMVVDRSDGLAVLETSDGSRLGVPAPLAEQARLSAIGSYVAVEFERLDERSSLVWVRPAFEPAPNRHSRTPGPSHLLSQEQHDRIERDVLVVG
jgi:hypothetical protein